MRTPKTSSKAVVVHCINHDPPPLQIPFSCCLSGTNTSSPNTQQYTEKATILNQPFATCCVFNSSKFQDLPESPIPLQCHIVHQVQNPWTVRGGQCYDFSYFVLFTYVFSLFLEVRCCRFDSLLFDSYCCHTIDSQHCCSTDSQHSHTHSTATLVQYIQWTVLQTIFFSQSLKDNPFT